MTIPKSPRVQGMKQIKLYLGRSRQTVIRWAARDNLPICKLDGRWEGDCKLIDAWFRRKITKGGNDGRT